MEEKTLEVYKQEARDRFDVSYFGPFPDDYTFDPEKWLMNHFQNVDSRLEIARESGYDLPQDRLLNPYADVHFEPDGTWKQITSRPDQYAYAAYDGTHVTVQLGVIGGIGMHSKGWAFKFG